MLSSKTIAALSKEFQAAVLELCDRIARETGYRPARLSAAARRGGGVYAVHQLLWRNEVSTTFRLLVACERPDLLVEVLVLRARWAPLFTSEERTIAALRLLGAREKAA